MKLHSRTILLSLLLVLVWALVPFHSQAQHLGYAPVRGQVIDSRTGRPAPGLTVSLVHPRLGRSAPAYTDRNGVFAWNAIPMRHEPYYMEIYWGRNLIYRQALLVTGPLLLPPIHL